MRKTIGEVEEDVFQLVKASSVSGLIGGGVYKQDMRPFNSDKEDVVVLPLTGVDGQVQNGTIIINAYVPDVDNGSDVLVKNTSRCRYLEKALNEMIFSLSTTEYEFWLDSMIQTFEEKEISQHYVNVRLRFKRVIF